MTSPSQSSNQALRLLISLWSRLITTSHHSRLDEARLWGREKVGFGEAAARERVAATEDEGLDYGVRPMVKTISPFPHIYTVVLYLYLDFGFALKLR